MSLLYLHKHCPSVCVVSHKKCTKVLRPFEMLVAMYVCFSVASDGSLVPMLLCIHSDLGLNVTLIVIAIMHLEC
jgi:hypothetical protein